MPAIINDSRGVRQQSTSRATAERIRAAVYSPPVTEPAFDDLKSTAPSRTRLRYAVGRVHLWLALIIGAYIVVISVSGSAVVFRREFNTWLVPRTVESTDGVRLTGDDLARAVSAAYPNDIVVEVSEPRRPERPVLVVLERDDAIRTDRLFDPYAARDLGETFPPTLRAVEWLVDLHDNLLAGETGRTINGIGGILFFVLIVTGAWIWWPGTRNVVRSLKIGKPQASRRFIRQLHNLIGVLSFLLLFVWAITAIYFAFPEPFEGTIDYFDPDLNDLERPGEWVVLELIKLHFGRFGGLPVRFLWAALGLLPAILFITGFIYWLSGLARRRAAARAAR
jgi:uncharacterized iron-regulated membrane protein